MNGISVLIPTFNSEAFIERTLKSVSFANEIVIVDSFSSDHTLEICRKYTKHIFQNPFENAAMQKNWGISKCSNAWILQVDSDEEIEDGMEGEIRRILESNTKEVCYKIPRMNYIYGQWFRTGGFYPDYQTRFFCKELCRFESRAVHEQILSPDGKYGYFSHHLIHHDFKDLTTHIHKINRYADYHLQELIKKNHHLNWWDIYLRAPLVFFHRYLIQGAVLQGYVGFLQSYLVSLEVFLKYAKLKEYLWKNCGKK